MTTVFDLPGSWLKCQLHSHTTNSDGDATPAELVAHYAGLGFDVLAITDHHFVTSSPSDALLVIPSSELTAEPSGTLEADILALGAERLPDPNESFASIEEAAKFIVEAGGVAFLAHPYWSMLEASAYLDAPSLTGIELMNGGSELTNGDGCSSEFWDTVLRHTGGRCLGIASDDCHSPGQDSNQAWTMVKAEETSRDAVLEALRTGAFYGSSGPTLERVTVGAVGVEVQCSAARSVTLRSGPWDGGRVNCDPDVMAWRGRVETRDPDGQIIAATMLFPEQCTYARVEIEDAAGRRAWTNPFPVPTAPGGAQSSY